MDRVEAQQLIARAKTEGKVLVEPYFGFLFFPYELDNEEAFELFLKTPDTCDWHLSDPQREFDTLCCGVRNAKNALNSFTSRLVKFGGGMTVEKKLPELL